jgi:hypothetical protein
MNIPVPNTPSMAEHTDVLLYIIGVLAIIVAGFVASSFMGLKSTLAKIDSRQTATEEDVKQIKDDLKELKIKHNIIHSEKEELQL